MNNPEYSRRELMRRLGTIMLGSIAAPGLARAGEMQDEPAFISIKKGAGEKGRVGGMDIVFKLTTEQTDGHMACDEATLQPGFLGAPPHRHQKTDEVCYMLEGALHIMVDGVVTEVSTGDWHLRPKGKVHTFWNPGKVPARFIDIYLPGGHERYMKDLAKLFRNNAKPKPNDFVALAAKHDIEYFWDQLPKVMETYKVHL
ncbi:MAG: cupin domain-containing protein [Mucilaginibacter polytrichastri]|nr:cupin domain-containing protein [Mucilaginibacter polytrichastri]